MWQQHVYSRLLGLAIKRGTWTCTRLPQGKEKGGNEGLQKKKIDGCGAISYDFVNLYL